MALRIFSRSKTRAENNLGIIQVDSSNETKLYRDPKLEKLDSYYENRQYDGKPDWDIIEGARGEPLSPRQRKPRIKVAYAKSLAQRVTSKLVGHSVFPKFTIEDSPDDQAFIAAVIRESKLKTFILEPVRRMLNTGSCLVRFYLSGGTMKVEWYNAKFCYPEFQDNGELKSVRIQYTYTDKKEKDINGNPKKKWYRLDLLMDREILFDNPEFSPGIEPVFEPVEEIAHNLGFVQAEWLRTCEMPDSVDGCSLTEDLMGFIDELNYSISQSSQAVSFNQDPQLTIAGMNSDELSDLVRSSARSWNMGAKGEAKFLESNLSGVEKAIELRDKVRQNIQEISRVVLLDPEKIVGSAQSAKAMETLYGPMIDLIDELRLPMEDILKNLILKMGLAILMANKQGIEVPIIIPPGYAPKSLGLSTEWPPIFQQTMEDLQKKVSVAVAAHTGRAIAKDTLVRFLAKDFGVEDVELEIKKIDAEPIINPFGGF